MFYVMSDIHGCYDAFVQALAHWNKEKETLVVLGDLVDRGPDSFKVVQKLFDLKEAYSDRVIVLKGNHDESFVEWLLDTPKEDLGFYYSPSHNETILSFFEGDKEKYQRSTRRQRGEHILYNHIDLLRFLHNLPMYHETEHCIFVHAGINLGLGDKWYKDERCMNWTRSSFIYSSIKAPKRTFFGHTPTPFIRNQNEETGYDYSIWISPEWDKVGIDGGIVFGGQLNALKINRFGVIRELLSFRDKQ